MKIFIVFNLLYLNSNLTLPIVFSKVLNFEVFSKHYDCKILPDQLDIQSQRP